MYIWTAISFDDQLAELRQQTACVSEDLALDNPSLTLPIHTSLTISFEVADEMYHRIITDLTDYFSSIVPFSIHTETIERNGNIIWLKMKQSLELTEMHTHLIDLLHRRYGVEPHPFDLDFKFHTTLFFGGGDHTLDTALSLIKATPLPDVLTARKFVIGISPSGEAGTYCICQKIRV